MLSWSRRGGPDGTNLAFNYGNNGSYGAVGHWGSPDMGWSGAHSPAPAAETWWHLVYTYDGTTTRLYVNGEENSVEDMTLNTHGGLPIRVAAQAHDNGTTADTAFNFTGSIAEVRIHDGVLSPADIMYNFAGPFQDPSPADGADHVANITLQWTYVEAPEGTTYTVSFGSDPDMMIFNFPASSPELPLGDVGAGLAAFDTTYYWQVTASDGEVSDLWSFTTEHNRPQFDRLEGTAQPQNTAVMVGGAAELSVAAGSFSPSTITYQWYKDGVAIEGATEPTVGTASATLEEEGVYTCVATNAFGSTESAPAVVDVQEGLIHRYTFNDGDVADVGGVLMALDVVGGADGTIINGTGLATVADGILTLGNSGENSNGFEIDDPGNTRPDGDYVDLPNGIISSLGAVTIETWVTWNDEARGVWQRVWAMGTSTGGEGSSAGAGVVGIDNIFVTPADGGGNFMAEWREPAVGMNPADGGLPVGQESLVTFIQDDMTGIAKLYVNGIAQAVLEAPRTLTTIDDNNNWLGRSQWGDTLLIGSYNEFRIHDTALSAEEVLANYLAGPDALGVLPDVGPCEVNVVGDVNGDCVVDLGDAAVLIENFLLDELFAD